MKPSIGRTVHFVSEGVHYAAVIVKVWGPDCVNLFVMPNGSSPILEAKVITSVLQDESAERDYSWHWPERE